MLCSSALAEHSNGVDAKTGTALFETA